MNQYRIFMTFDGWAMFAQIKFVEDAESPEALRKKYRDKALHFEGRDVGKPTAITVRRYR